MLTQCVSHTHVIIWKRKQEDVRDGIKASEKKRRKVSPLFYPMRLAIANSDGGNMEKKTKKDDLATVRFMIELYCRGKHKTKKGELCDECRELAEYVGYRRSLCPFGDDKPFCSNCRIHCYKPEMREKIKAVMRYSGPRMLFYDPKVALAHVFETIGKKKRDKKALKEKAARRNDDTGRKER